MSNFLRLYVKKKLNDFKKISLSALPILQLDRSQREFNRKKNFFEEKNKLTNNTDNLDIENSQTGVVVSGNKNIGGAALDINSIVNPNTGIKPLLKKNNFFFIKIQDMLNSDLLDYDFNWVDFSNNVSIVESSGFLAFFYVNILGLILLTFLTVDYPLVPVLFVLELLMFIPVLLLYVLTNDSTFMYLICIINATTVEAVGAVGITMTYLMGLQYKEITNKDVLESSIFAIYKMFGKTTLKKYSWYYINSKRNGGFLEKIIKKIIINFKMTVIVIFIFIQYLVFLKLKITILGETFNGLFVFEKIINFINNYWNADIKYLKRNNIKILKNLEIKKYSEQLRLIYFGNYVEYSVYFEKNKKYLNKSKVFIKDFYYNEGGLFKSFSIFQNFKTRHNLNSGGFLLNYVNRENPINSLIVLLVSQQWLNSNSFEKSMIFNNSIKTRGDLFDKVSNANPITGGGISKNKINMLLYEFFQIGLFTGKLAKIDTYLNSSKLNNRILDKENLNFYKKLKKKKLLDINAGKMENTVDYFLNFIGKSFNNSKYYTKKLMSFGIKDLHYFEKLLNNPKFIENTFNIKNIKYTKTTKQKSNLVEEFSILFFDNIKFTKNRWVFDKKFKKVLITQKYVKKFNDMSYFSKFNYNFYIKNNKYYQKYGNSCSSVQMFGGLKIPYWGILFQNLSQNFEIKKLKNWIFSIRTIYSKNKEISLKTKYNHNLVIPYSIYKTKINILREWGDKSYWPLIKPTSKVLPWFEEHDHDSKIYDFSELGLFNDATYYSELVKIDLCKKVKKITKLLSSSNLQEYDFKTLYYDYYLKRYGNTLKGFKSDESSKIDISVLKLDWNYWDTFESQRQLMYSSLLSKYYEDFVYLKRLKKINQNFPSTSPRNVGLWGNDYFEVGKNSIYSEQSNEFGFISLDFLSNKFFFDQKTNDFGTNWLIFGKISGIFSYLNSFETHHTFNNKLIGARRLNTKNSITSLFDIKKNKKSNIILNIWNSNLGAEIDRQNPEQSENTEFSENFEKLNNQNQLKFFKFFLNNSNSDKLELFSLPGETSTFLHNSFEFENNWNWKKITDDRFLLTFKKKLKKRDNWLAKSLNRFDSEITKSNNTYKIMKGLRTKINWVNRSSMLKQDHQDLSNKLLYLKKINFNKLAIVEDGEILDDLERISVEKPHTFYGYLWEEYLKQSYDVNLNFLKFNEKILNTNKEYSLKNVNLLSNNFQKNIEKNLKANSMLMGLSKDREIANMLTAQLLAKFGFIRELSELGTASTYWQNKNNYKNTKEGRQEYRIPFLLNKKKIFTEIIIKNKLNKKSIDNIKKFSETPYGFKEETTVTGLKLPYIKRKFWVKNEDSHSNYYNSNLKYGWISEKNNNPNFTNRYNLLSKFGGISTEKTITSLPNFWKDSNLKSSNYFNLFDFDSSIIGSANSEDYLQNNSNFYHDFDYIGLETMENISENKRYLYRIKPIDGKIENIIKSTKTLTGFSLRKNQLIKKKQVNLRLFKKLEIYGIGFLSSSSILKYHNHLNFEKEPNLNNLKTIRRWKHFGDFHIFKNPIIQHFRNSNQKLNNILTDNLKKTIKRKKLIFKIFNTNETISRNYTDLFPNTILLENSLSLKNNNNQNSGKYYKVSMYNSERFQNFISKNDEIFLKLTNNTSPILGKFQENSNIFKLDENDTNYFKSLNNNILAYTIKNSWAGFINLNKNQSTNYERFFKLNYKKNESFIKNIIKFKRIPRNKNILKLGNTFMGSYLKMFNNFKIPNLVWTFNMSEGGGFFAYIKNTINSFQKLSKLFLIFKIKNNEKIEILNNFFKIIKFPTTLKPKDNDMIQILYHISSKIIFTK